MLFSAIGVTRVKNKVSNLYEQLVNTNNYLNTISEKLYSALIENHIFITGTISWAEIFRKNTQNSEIILSKLTELDNYNNNNQKDIQLSILIENFSEEYAYYENINREIITLLRNHHDSAAITMRNTKELASFQKLQELIRELSTHNAKIIRTNYEKIKKNENNLISIIYTLGITVILLTIIFTYFLIKNFSFDYHKLKYQLQAISEGQIPSSQLNENKNEFGKISTITNYIHHNIQKMFEFTEQIGKGNYSYEYKSKGNTDILGNSLVHLRNSLVEAKIDEQKRQQEDKQRNWITQGLAKFGDILRQSAGNMQTLADEIIKNLVYYLNANQGGLFIYNDFDKDNIHLSLLSAFAYDRKKYLTKTIKIGEGLVGMCALEKATTYLTEIPNDYIEIESGLGDANPKSLLIVPLKTESGILGVIEIASFNLLPKYEIEFVEELAQSIASTLSTAKINARTAELLEESQKKSDELASREAELRQTMSDMRLAQDESQRRQAEMASILSAVDQTLLKSEIDITGKIISANQRFLNTLGYHTDEVKEKKIFLFIPDYYLKEFETIWENIISGHSHRDTVRHISKQGKDVWLLNQYTPVFDTKGKVIRILYMANDISEQKLAEDKSQKLLQESLEKAQELMATQQIMAENEIEMKSILTAIDSTLMKAEYSVEGNLFTANQRHIDTMGYDFEETKGKNILTFVPEDEIEEFKKLWQSVCEGHLHQITVKRKSKLTGKDIWLLNQYTPVKDKSGKVLKVLYMAIDITKQKEIEEKANIQASELKQQEEVMKQNLETLNQKQIELQSRLANYEQTEDEISSEFDTEIDKLYSEWLKSFH